MKNVNVCFMQLDLRIRKKILIKFQLNILFH